MEFDCFKDMNDQLDAILKMARILPRWRWRQLCRWLRDTEMSMLLPQTGPTAEALPHND